MTSFANQRICTAQARGDRLELLAVAADGHSQAHPAAAEPVVKTAQPNLSADLFAHTALPRDGREPLSG